MSERKPGMFRSAREAVAYLTLWSCLAVGLITVAVCTVRELR